MLELAGVDTTKGKAKSLLENMDAGHVSGINQKGTWVWTDDGEGIVELIDVPVGTTERQLSQNIAKALNASGVPQAAGYWSDEMPSEGEVIPQSDLDLARGMADDGALKRMRLNDYLKNLVQRISANMSGQ